MNLNKKVTVFFQGYLLNIADFFIWMGMNMIKTHYSARSVCVYFTVINYTTSLHSPKGSS